MQGESYIRAMTQLQIQVPPTLDAALAARVARGGYLDAGEYLRDLMRRDLSAEADERLWLRAMIEEGIVSGVEEKDAFEVLQEIIDEDPELRG